MTTEVTLVRFEDYAKFLEYEENIDKFTDIFNKEICPQSEDVDFWRDENKKGINEYSYKKWKFLSEKGLVSSLGGNLYAPITYKFTSSIHKNHKFKIGHFISEYNQNSFDTRLTKSIGKNLFNVFGLKMNSLEIDRYQQHDWLLSYYNAMHYKELYLQHIKKYSEAESDFITNGLDIIAETCDYIMNRPDSKKLFLRWII
jgi:hypothetical protein